MLLILVIGLLCWLVYGLMAVSYTHLIVMDSANGIGEEFCHRQYRYLAVFTLVGDGVGEDDFPFYRFPVPVP